MKWRALGLSFVGIVALSVIILLAISSFSSNNDLYKKPISYQCVNANPSYSLASHANLYTSDETIPNNNLSQPNTYKTKPAGWYTFTYGNNTSSFKYLNTGFGDGRSIKVQTYSYKSGDAAWTFDNVNVTSGQNYFFSDYYKSNSNSEIDASFLMNNGSYDYEILGFANKSSDWRQFNTTFIAPPGAQSVSIEQYISGIGWLTTSDYSLHTYSPIGFSRPLVTLTFDDGYQDTYKYGLPLLNKYGFKSTQFIISGEVGFNQYMTAANIQALSDDGNEIASHTVTHDNLTTIPESDVAPELIKSNQTLAPIIDQHIPDFAYPLGQYNDEVSKQVQNDFVAARGVEQGLNNKNNFNCYDLKTQDVHNTTTAAQVSTWVNQAKQTNSWLILIYHSVEPNLKTSIGKSEFNVTPSQLNAQLDAIKQTGVKVVSMNQAIRQLSPQNKWNFKQVLLKKP